MQRAKTIIGIIALISGIIALILAVSSGDGAISYEAEKVSLTERGVGFLKEKILGDDPEPVRKGRRLAVENVGALALGLIAVISGVIAIFIRAPRGSGERRGLQVRFDAGSAGLALGLGALLWSYILIAVVVGVILFILSGLMSGTIDIGF